MESVRRHLGGGPGPVPYPYGAGTVAAAPSHRLSERPMFNRRHEMYELPPVRTIAGPKRFVCDEPSCGRAFSKKVCLCVCRERGATRLREGRGTQQRCLLVFMSYF